MDKTTDFFISYNKADRGWAEWVAWVLEENGRSVTLQAWDFRPGMNFVQKMQSAAISSKRTVAILSADFLRSGFTAAEWSAAFVQDPTGHKRKLIPLRVRDCRPEGVLGQLIYVDLLGKGEKEAENELLAALPARAKPSKRPGFPGAGTAPVPERVTPERAPFPAVQTPLQAWRERLSSLEVDEAMVTSAAEKFELQQLIQEARTQLEAPKTRHRAADEKALHAALPAKPPDPRFRAQGKAITWLHLSDLHVCSARSKWDAQPVMQSLLKSLREQQHDHGLRPDLIFFTGDAAFGNLGSSRGKRLQDQFEEAAVFFKAVREAFDPPVAMENFFIVPGNHDVDRSKAVVQLDQWLTAHKGDSEAKAVTTMIENGGSDWKMFMSRLDVYRKFLAKAGYRHLLHDQDAKRLIYSVVREICGVKVGIAGLNSAWSSSEGLNKGDLWMGGAWQIGTLRSQLMELQPSFCVALVHHPANWLVESEDPQVWREIEKNFQFCLHGHEHRSWIEEKQEYTRIAGAAGYDRANRDNGYNIVRLDLNDGNAEVWLRKFDPDSGEWIPRILRGTARTNNDGLCQLRELRWLKAIVAGKPDVADPPGEGVPEYTPVEAVPSSPWRCDSYYKIWEVILPAGNLVTTEFFHGLRRKDGKPGDLLTLFQKSNSLTMADFKAESLTPGHKVSMETDLKEGGEGGSAKMTYQLRFSPPVTDRVDVICQRMAWGVILPSRLAQNHWKVSDAEKGWECSTQVISIPAEYLDISLRFSPASFAPPSVNLFVKNERDADVTESVGAQVRMHYWRPECMSSLHPYVAPCPSPEVVLSISRPKENYVYGVRWDLPERIPHANRHLVDKARSELLGLEHPAAREAAGAFLAKVMTWVRDEILQPAGGRWWDDVYACLFGFDAASGTLRCVEATGGWGTRLPQRTIGWGKDIIGSAFRFRKAMLYSRRELLEKKAASGFRLLEQLPEEVQALYACPLNWPQWEGGTPLGVLALASSSDKSGLQTLVGEQASEGMREKCYREWEASRPKILPGTLSHVD